MEQIDMIDSTKECIKWMVPIKGKEDKYWITNTGMIWSRISNKWLKLNVTDKYGHLSVALDTNKSLLVHRLVYQHFKGPIPKGKKWVIHHLDEDPTNNTPSNLFLTTRGKHTADHHRGKHQNKGNKLSQQHKRKIGEANKGKKRPPQTQQTRRKKSEAHKGITSGMKGKHHSQQTKQKMRQSHRRKQ